MFDNGLSLVIYEMMSSKACRTGGRISRHILRYCLIKFSELIERHGGTLPMKMFTV